MVDIEARKNLSELIRQLIAGFITNDQFEDRIPRSSDPAVHEIYFNGIWGLYTDFYEYRLIGEDRVPQDSRRVLARYILFLKSGLEYEWPRQSYWQFLLSFGAALLTLGLSNRWYRKSFAKAGDLDVWPFIREHDFEVALREPPYLRGCG